MKLYIKTSTLREVITLIDERIGSIPPTGSRNLDKIRIWKKRRKEIAAVISYRKAQTSMSESTPTPQKTV